MNATGVARTGTLTLVVGPSGAGKDTLIAIAKDLVGGERTILFPRRVVTRERSAAEDHDSLSPGEFDDAARQGAFAFWWEAHGLKYGLPVRVNDDIGDGKTVVCNVSRQIVPRLRQSYMSCKVVLVDAPREVRTARIAARHRVTDAASAERLDRHFVDRESFVPDLVIQNVGDPRDGGRALADLLLGVAARPVFPPPSAAPGPALENGAPRPMRCK